MEPQGMLTCALAEMCVVVGLDENTGLKPVNPQPEVTNPEEEALFRSAFEPQVLCAVSSNLALFPFSNPKQDPNYPPSSATTPVILPVKTSPYQQDRKDEKKKSRRMGVFRNHSAKEKKNSEEPGAIHRGGFLSLKHQRVTRKTSFTAVDFARKQADRSSVSTIGPQELPISFDVINSLATFCYPDYAFARQYHPEDQVHFLVLTNMSGTRSYAACITINRLYIVQKEEDDPDSWRCVLWPKMATTPEIYPGQSLCYLPSCIVVISKYPYFTVLKDCLSRLVQKIRQSPEDLPFYIKEFALQLTMTPTPPAGKLALQFIMDQVMFTLYPADDPDKSVVDFPLQVVFQCFSVEQILTLLGAVLTQQKIVFLSSSYALLTLVMESLLIFIRPFKWSSTYVTVLSQKLVELIDAPGYFMMGCHSCHRQYTNDVDGLVVADIDHGEITVSPSISLPSMPCIPCARFETAYRTAKYQLELIMLECPTTFMYEETKKFQDNIHQQFNQEILTACLTLMVDLFRDVVQFIKVEKRFFNKDQFLESVDPADQPFYKQVLQTEHFRWFLRDRITQKADYWSSLEEKTRPSNRNSLQNQSSSLVTSPSKRRPGRISISMVTKQASQKPQYHMAQLPNFLPDQFGQFYEKCEQEFTEKMQEKHSNSVRASFLYLRGMMKAARGDKVNGLEDFHSLWAFDKKLFPLRIVTEILQSMSHKEKALLVKTAFYKKSEEWQQVNLRRQSSMEQPIIMDLEKIPNHDVDEDAFREHIQLLDITQYPDTITRLFHALTLKKQAVVDPNTFEVFYESWKELEMPGRELRLPDANQNRESILKVSSLIKTSYGTGRLILTQKRLFFLTEGTKNWKEVMRLQNIRSINKTLEQSFFTKIPSIKLYNEVANAPSFVAFLKGARDEWYMSMTEMWAGKRIAEEMRDPGVIQRAAQNVQLINAVFKSGKESCCFHHSSPDTAAQFLAHFTEVKQQGIEKLTVTTKNVLQHRVDPSIYESERKAVESLLYCPGNQSTTLLEGHGPSLWCGLGCGKLIVFDASTWVIKHCIPEAKRKITCLSLVDQDHVWASSFDQKIYVVDVYTKECHHTLEEHTDIISSMSVSKENRLVFSCTLNGQIIAWDIESLQCRKKINIAGVNSLKAIHYHEGELWCCSRQELRVISTDGKEQKKIAYDDPAMQLDCFILTPNNEVWLGCGKQGEVHVYDIDSFLQKSSIPVPCRGISKLLHIQGKVWAGGKDGSVYIIDMETYEVHHHLTAHSDSVRALCTAEDRYVMSGAGSQDGRVCIWRMNEEEGLDPEPEIQSLNSESSENSSK